MQNNLSEDSIIHKLLEPKLLNKIMTYSLVAACVPLMFFMLAIAWHMSQQ